MRGESVVRERKPYSVKDTTLGLNLFRKAPSVSPLSMVSTTEEVLLEFPFCELKGMFAVQVGRTSVEIPFIKSLLLVTNLLRPLRFTESSLPCSLYRISYVPTAPDTRPKLLPE